MKLADSSVLSSALAHALAVGLGGFVGALARWGLAGIVHRQLPATTFPVGTLAVNLVGCFSIGAFLGFVETRHLLGPAARSFVLVGVLGSFTTFSTFGWETLALWKDREFLRAASNVVVQVVLGLLLVALGYRWTAAPVSSGATATPARGAVVERDRAGDGGSSGPVRSAGTEYQGRR